MTPEQLTEFLETLNSPSPAVRVEAADRLCRLGPDARPAAVALVQACGDEHDEVRELAGAALEGIGAPGESDVPTLAEMVAHEHDEVAYWAITLLGRCGAAAAAAIEPLARELVGQAIVARKQRAAWALGEIGPAAAVAVPRLQSASKSDNPRLARLATRAIETIRRNGDAGDS